MSALHGLGVVAKKTCCYGRVVPPGLESVSSTFPSAEALGYFRSPLRGWILGQFIASDWPIEFSRTHSSPDFIWLGTARLKLRESSAFDSQPLKGI